MEEINNQNLIEINRTGSHRDERDGNKGNEVKKENGGNVSRGWEKANCTKYDSNKYVRAIDHSCIFQLRNIDPTASTGTASGSAKLSACGTIRSEKRGKEERNRNLKGSKGKEKISDANDYSHFNTLTYFSEF